MQAAGLALAAWLGITDLPAPRLATAPPELLITGAGLDEAALRAGLRQAGMRADAALYRRFDAWPPAAPLRSGALALVIAAEDSRSLERLPAGLELGRSAGGPALVATLPDRGALTRMLAWPLVRRRLDAAVDAGRHRTIGTVIREHAQRITVMVRVAGPGRGTTAPTIPQPRLQAPALPLPP
ncbi:MAG TPA: hypothetical protein VLA56_20110 [Pseudomonadales bacterium]|nr:hypothetical protein [Pseudomonadales bacterium]